MSKSDTKPDIPAPVVYSREAVLDYDQLALGLGVSRRIAEKMNLPFFMAGERPRFLWGQVLDVLAQRAENAA